MDPLRAILFILVLLLSLVLLLAHLRARRRRKTLAAWTSPSLGSLLRACLRSRALRRRPPPPPSPPPPPPLVDRPIRDVRALQEPFRTPAWHLRGTDESSTSWLGGTPPDHEGFVWPLRDGRPLAFLACLDAASFEGLAWMPKGGRVLVFHDLEEGGWGYCPSHRGSWAVRHVPESDVLPTLAAMPRGVPEWARVPRKDVVPASIQTVPDSEHAMVAPWDLSPSEIEAWHAPMDVAYGDLPAHQVGGYPLAIQGPRMDLECELIAQGEYLGGDWPDEARVDACRPAAAEWRLLLQFDTDEDLGVELGDGGRIYYWVRDQEAREARFENVWAVLQCY